MRGAGQGPSGIAIKIARLWCNQSLSHPGRATSFAPFCCELRRIRSPPQSQNTVTSISRQQTPVFNLISVESDKLIGCHDNVHSQQAISLSSLHAGSRIALGRTGHGGENLSRSTTNLPLQASPSSKTSPYSATDYRDPSNLPPVVSKLTSDGRVTANEVYTGIRGTIPIFGNTPMHVFSHQESLSRVEWLGDGGFKTVQSMWSG